MHLLIHHETDSTVSDGNLTILSPIANSSNASGLKTNSCNKILDEVSNNAANQSTRNSFNTILPTALILLRGRSGYSVFARALLDQDSQASFITQSIVQLIKADCRPAHISDREKERVPVLSKVWRLSLLSRMIRRILSVFVLVLSTVTSQINKHHSFLKSLHSFGKPQCFKQKIYWSNNRCWLLQFNTWRFAFPHRSAHVIRVDYLRPSSKFNDWIKTHCRTLVPLKILLTTLSGDFRNWKKSPTNPFGRRRNLGAKHILFWLIIVRMTDSSLSDCYLKLNFSFLLVKLKP